VARALYATDARVSEFLAVRRDQVSLDGDRARVRLVRTKGDVERLVRIPAGLLAEIDAEYQAPGRAFLFESRHGHPFSRQYVSRELTRASKRGARQASHGPRPPALAGYRPIPRYAADQVRVRPTRALRGGHDGPLLRAR